VIKEFRRVEGVTRNEVTKFRTAEEGDEVKG
jgi:hypothetical protein